MLKTILGVSVITASLFATQIDNNWEVGVGAGYMKVKNSDKLDNHGLVNVKVGKHLPKNHILRVEVEKASSLKRALVNVEHDFENHTRVTPYAYVGAGKEWVNKDNYKNSKVADLGIGAKYKINKAVNLFAEARALRSFKMNDNHYGAIAGVNYEFGENKPKVKDGDHDGIADNIDQCPNTPRDIKVDATGCPIDSDHDGVANYLDKCPNTPAGMKVDKDGCLVVLDSDHDGVLDKNDKCPNTPAGIKVDKDGCKVVLDSDHDGVVDNIDKCPNTPLGVRVNANGCALDSDHDGVADNIDQCPNTPAGVVVNNKGCAVTFNFDVHFQTNSSRLNIHYLQKVKQFAEFLKQNPAYKAEIDGYTDNRGSKRHNISLSEKRAKSVYIALIKLGVSPRRLSYKGFGPFDSIASNRTKEGRKLNRRVVAKLFL